VNDLLPNDLRLRFRRSRRLGVDRCWRATLWPTPHKELPVCATRPPFGILRILRSRGQIRRPRTQRFPQRNGLQGVNARCRASSPSAVAEASACFHDSRYRGAEEPPRQWLSTSATSSSGRVSPAQPGAATPFALEALRQRRPIGSALHSRWRAQNLPEGFYTQHRPFLAGC